MTFKHHLVIIIFISIMVYAGYVFTRPAPVAPGDPSQIIVKESPYSITITHASWGMNCARQRGVTQQQGNYDPAAAFSDDPSTKKLREDNVLLRVSELCNDKLQCDILNNPDVLGDDPSPTCSSKLLEVEYRCFSYDRPWIVRSQQDININCDRS